MNDQLSLQKLILILVQVGKLHYKKFIKQLKYPRDEILEEEEDEEVKLELLNKKYQTDVLGLSFRQLELKLSHCLDCGTLQNERITIELKLILRDLIKKIR